MDSEAKNYELAYLLSPSIDEGEILTYSGKLVDLITNAKGAIKHNEVPRKWRLAYSIKKQINAYFGWITFKISSDQLKELEKKLKSEGILLRFLLSEEEENKVPVRLGAPVLRTLPTRQKVAVSPQKGEIKPEDEKLDLEALDKRLDEILGK